MHSIPYLRELFDFSCIGYLVKRDSVNIKVSIFYFPALLNSLNGRTNEDTIIQVETFPPRSEKKLILCVYPRATIVPFVFSMTGLDNYNQTGQSKFGRKIGNLFHIFLSCLPSPGS